MVSVNLKPTFDGLSFILGLQWVLNELLGEYDVKAFLESVCQDLNSAEMGLNWCLLTPPYIYLYSDKTLSKSKENTELNCVCVCV